MKGLIKILTLMIMSHEIFLRHHSFWVNTHTHTHDKRQESQAGGEERIREGSLW